MLNQSGVTSQKFGAPKQILANVELQMSVGCVVDAALGVDIAGTGKKIAKAGTPINIDLENTLTPVKAVTEGTPMNAVLLHDVDVTRGNANGTATYFGSVNINRLDQDVVSKVSAAKAVDGASPLLVFVKL